MVYFCRRRNRADLDYGIQGGGLCAFRSTQGDLPQIHNRLHLAFGILHGQHVRIATFRIDPVVRSDHAIGSQRGDDVVHDFFLRETQLAGLLAVDIQLQRGIIDVLGNQHVADATEPPRWLRNLRCHRVNLIEIVSAHLYVDGCGQAQVQHRVDKTSRLKIGGELGQLLTYLFAYAAHVFVTAQLVTFLEAGLYERGVRRGVGRIDRGKIRRDADVGDDHG